MKSKYCFFIALLISILLLYLIQHLTICEAGSITKLGTTATLLPSGEFGSVFDDFNDGDLKNNWGYSTSSGGSGTCTVSYVGGAYEGAKCLKLDYSVPAAESFSWYASKMGSENIESSNFNGLIFWVKGTAGGEYFKIELRTIDCNSTGRSNAKIYITDYLDGGVTTNWQKVVIPLKNFANITNFTKMDEFTIAFEHDQSLINGSPTNGTVYIDCIKFTNVAGGFDVVRLDHYGDKDTINALGGQMGDAPGGGGSQTVEINNIASHFFSNGLDYRYNVSSGWAAVYIIFGGGNNGWIKMPCDLSDYNRLTFNIKAKSAGENPGEIKIELKSPTVSFVRKSGITTTWQKFSILLNSFSGLNKNAIEELCFTFEDWRVTNKIGEVYIDEVQFEK